MISLNYEDDYLSEQDVQSPKSQLSFGECSQPISNPKKPNLKLDLNFSSKINKIQSIDSISSDFDDYEFDSLAEKETQDYDSPHSVTPTFKSSSSENQGFFFFQSPESSKENKPIQEHWSDFAINTPNERKREAMYKPKFAYLKRKQQIKKQQLQNFQQKIVIKSCNQNQVQQLNTYRQVQIQNFQQQSNIKCNKKIQEKMNRKQYQQQNSLQNQIVYQQFQDNQINNQQCCPQNNYIINSNNNQQQYLLQQQQHCISQNYFQQQIQQYKIQQQQQQVQQNYFIQQQQISYSQQLQFNKNVFQQQQQSKINLVQNNNMGQQFNLSGAIWKAIQNNN